MSKPDWKDAPKWAKWLAQDSDGEWFWYSEEPSLPSHKAGWIAPVGAFQEWARKTPNHEQFQLTLERRP